jgi:hypothetical protein
LAVAILENSAELCKGAYLEPESDAAPAEDMAADVECDGLDVSAVHVATRTSMNTPEHIPHVSSSSKASRMSCDSGECGLTLSGESSGASPVWSLGCLEGRVAKAVSWWVGDLARRVGAPSISAGPVIGSRADREE